MILVVDQEGNVIPAAEIEPAAPLEYRGNNVWEMGRVRTTEPPPTLTAWQTEWKTQYHTLTVTQHFTEATKVSPFVTRRPWGNTRFVTEGAATEEKWGTATRDVSREVSATAVRDHTRLVTEDEPITRQHEVTDIEGPATEDKAVSKEVTDARTVAATAGELTHLLTKQVTHYNTEQVSCLTRGKTAVVTDEVTKEVTADPCGGCNTPVFADITTDCGNSCSDTYRWDCNDQGTWAFTSGACGAENLTYDGSTWTAILLLNGYTQCEYDKSGGDCPTGSYTRRQTTCGDSGYASCDDPLDVYS